MLRRQILWKWFEFRERKNNNGSVSRWDTPSHKLVDLAGAGAGTSTDSPDHRVLGDRTVSGASLLDSIRIINSSRPTATSQAIQSVTMQLLAQHCVLDVALAPVRFQEAAEDTPDTAAAQHGAAAVSKEKERKSLKKSARRVMLKVKTVRNMKRANTEEDSEEEPEDDDPDGGLLSRGGGPHRAAGDGGEQLTWPGKDYVNWIVRDLARPELHDQDNADRETTPRMPWHDIGLGVAGPAARDVARHFIQRWNHLKAEKLRYNDNYTYLVPKAYDVRYGDADTAAEEVLGGSEAVQVQVRKHCRLHTYIQQTDIKHIVSNIF